MAERKKVQSTSERKMLSRRNMLLGGLSVAAAGVAGAGYFLGRTNVRLAPGRSRARPVLSLSPVPKAVDAVVIGGGIVGTTTAFTLAERGLTVALCEKGVIAGEASGRAMGFVYSHYEDRENGPLLARSKELWNSLTIRGGIDTSFRPLGLVTLFDSQEELGGAEAWLASVRGVPGFDSRIISAKELQSIYPGMLDPPQVSLYSQSDGAVEPTLAAPAVADACRVKGASVLQGCAVRGLEMSAGRISGVVTEKGRIACQSVVVACGAWTPLFVRSLGVHYDQFDMYLSMIGLTPVPGPQVSLSNSAYGFRRRPDGSYSIGVIDLSVPIRPETIANFRTLMPMIKAFGPIAHPGLSPTDFWQRLRAPTHWSLDEPSPFEERRILMPEFSGEAVEAALAKLKVRFPVFQLARIAERWTGAMSVTLDGMPVISAVPNWSGLFIGSGFANGITYGPAAGEALADLAMGRPPAVDLRSYRLGRFNDGSDIRFHQ